MVAISDRSPHPKFTNPEEYFAWEEKQEVRHEYIDGEVYAMSGGTINHSLIALNFGALLRNHLSGSGCRTLNSDARVKIHLSERYVYPDLSVTCDDRDRSTTQYITYPCLIVEVLSETTEAYDRGEKFKKYRRNPNLQEYVLVNADKIAVDIYSRDESGKWYIINYEAGEHIELKSVNLTFAIERIYEDVIFDLDNLTEAEN
jgi:Uma2 family endonuclease